MGAHPVPAGLAGVMRVAAGGYHSLALLTNGTVVGWGVNSDGQAAPPTNLVDVVEIAAGMGHSLALKTRWHRGGMGQQRQRGNERACCACQRRCNRSW
jgi:alpha-tubulin suppressor-like RCC1 family protein